MTSTKEHSLPPKWTLLELGEILLPTSTRDPKRDGPGQFTYIDIEALDNSQQRITSPKRIDNLIAPSRARNVLRTGDVLFSLVRPYLKNIAVVYPELDGAVASTAYLVCRPGPGIDSRYLLNYFRQNSFIESIVTYGNSPPAARDDEFRRLKIPVAPSDEQARIADKLDELFSDLDAGVEALKRVREKLKLYRASVLKAAVEGKLTEEWRKQNPNVEPASELLKRILADRRKRWEEDQLLKFRAAGKKPPEDWKVNYKEPVAPDDSVKAELPNGWSTCSGDAFFSFITSGSRGWAKYYSEQGALFIRMGNLNHGSVSLDLNDRQHVKPPIDSEGTRTRVQPQDLLISITADVGMISLVPEAIEEAYINQHVALARPVMRETAAFAAWYLASPAGGQIQLKDLQRGATKVGLGLDDIRAVTIPLPPIEEQDAIVDAIEEQLASIEHLEIDMDRVLAEALALRQSALRHAFTGQLVSQKPNDEPATILLQRIHRLRENERLAQQLDRRERLAVRNNKSTSKKPKPPKATK